MKFAKPLTLMALLGAGAGLAAPLQMSLSLKVDGQPLEFGKTYQNVAGNAYQLSLVKFYLSEVALVRADGSELPLPGIRLLEFNASTPTQNVSIWTADVPADTYKGVRFSIGLPRELNHQDPTTQQAPLGVDSGMVWAWNPGYIFYKVEGKAVTSQSQQAFTMHMGTDPYKLQYNLADLQLQKIQLQVPETGGTVKLGLDVAQLFKAGTGGEPYDLSQSKYQQVHGGPVIGAVYLNMQGAFKLE